MADDDFFTEAEWERYPEMEDLYDDMSETEFEPSDIPDEVPEYRNNVIIVTGLPVAPEKKLKKLVAFISQYFAQFGDIVPDGLFMPVNSESGSTEGVALIEYAHPDSARLAKVSANGAALDAKHTLGVVSFADYDKIMDVPDEMDKMTDQKDFANHDFCSWLLDSTCRDQFLIRHDEHATPITAVYWADTHGAPVLENDGAIHRENGVHWTERMAMWSPHGNYLATFHRPGLKLWAGPQFEDAGKFAHDDVDGAVFSPNENFIATWSEYADSCELNLWDVRTGMKLKTWQTKYKPEVDVSQLIGFSADSEYFAWLNKKDGKNFISVYTTKDMRLLDKSSITAPGAQSLSWAPEGRNILVWFSPEHAQRAASVTVMDIPSRRVVRQKNLFNVLDFSFHWQQAGDFLCVQVQRLSKSQMKQKKRLEKEKKAVAMDDKRLQPSTSLEIFYLEGSETAPTIPVDFVERPGKLGDFSWEPRGKRFAFTEHNGKCWQVSFYDAIGTGHKATPLKTLTINANRVFWSPTGPYAVLAGLQALNGQLAFYNVDRDNIMGKEEHQQCNVVQWDPTGRTVATAKVIPRVTEANTRDRVQNGYRLYSFTGDIIHGEDLEICFQFLWRPRPVDIISDAVRAEVDSSLSQWIGKYTGEDKIRRNARRCRELLEKRDRILDWRARMEELVEARKRSMAEMGASYDAQYGGQAREATHEILKETLIEKRTTTVSEADVLTVLGQHS